jgi:hypothetical protein
MNRPPLQRLVFAAATLAAAGLVPRVGASQSVRGTVVDPGGNGVPGIVVQLLDSADAIRARALTDRTGAFLVIAPTAGAYRVQTLRIGFRSVISEPLALTAGAEVTRRFEVASLPSRLDTVRVGGRSECGRASRDAVALAAVWEQARTAMIAADLSTTGKTIAATRVTYQRKLDNVGFRTLEASSRVATGTLAKPWPAPTPADLHGAGFIVQGADSTSYRAPGLDMLASTYFIDDHCFRLTNGRDRETIGVAFDATPERRALGEIRGTVYLDKTTSELRELEFRYVHRENPDLEAGAKGAMSFVRLADGAWAISQWEIRAPSLELRRGSDAPRMARPGRLNGSQSEVVVSNVHVMGGSLALAVAGADTLWARPPLELRGDVRDSASGKPVAGARVSLSGTDVDTTTGRDGRFVMRRVQPGTYTLFVHTPGLDSLGTVNQTDLEVTDGKDEAHVRVPAAAQVVSAICRSISGAATNAASLGIIAGEIVVPGGDVLAARAKVTAEWTDPVTGASRAAEGPVDREGKFRICSVPYYMPVTLRASTESASAAPQVIAISEARRIERATLTLDRPGVANSVLAGIVTDSAGAPIAGVEVSLTSAGVTRITDGKGTFRLPDLTPGTHQLVARKVGYGPLDVQLVFGPNETVRRTIVLSRITVLNEVRVTAAFPDPAMDAFREHVKVGLGHFIMREELEKNAIRPLANLVQMLPGTRIVTQPNGKADIATSRRCKDYLSNTCPPCPSAVYLDKMLMTRWERIDINTFPVADIEAVEWYASRGQAPIEYNDAKNECGVLVIHTRRPR